MSTPRRGDAQRRRTRRAIVDAAIRLTEAGVKPSVDQIAEEADVSRRTVYMYFPTLERLLIDATAGALANAGGVDGHAAPDTAPDTLSRVDRLVEALAAISDRALPLGRRLIALTVETPPSEADRRGVRRLDWIERAVEPLADRLDEEQTSRLVSALAVVIGWEAMIVLRDVCGLDRGRELEVNRWIARVLVEAVTAEAATRTA